MVRPTEWAKAAREYLVPKLPGAWGHRNALLYQQPIDWLLCSVVMQTRQGSRSFQMSAGVQLLCEPAEYLIADLSLDKRVTRLGEFRDLPEDLALAEPDRVAAIAAAARRDHAEAVALLSGQAAWSRTKLRLPRSG